MEAPVEDVLRHDGHGVVVHDDEAVLVALGPDLCHTAQVLLARLHCHGLPDEVGVLISLEGRLSGRLLVEHGDEGADGAHVLRAEEVAKVDPNPFAELLVLEQESAQELGPRQHGRGVNW